MSNCTRSNSFVPFLRCFIFKLGMMVILNIYLLGCQSNMTFVTGYEYLESKGFTQSLFAQIRHGDIVKNNNEQLPEILHALHDSEIVPKRPVTPTYTIYLETGSSFPSQKVSIQIGEDGYGLMQHLKEQVYFYCAQLPTTTQSAFNQSTIILQ